MVKSLCHLLMKVNYDIIANFYVANMSFNAFRKNKNLAKISEFTVLKKNLVRSAKQTSDIFKHMSPPS